LNLTVEALTHRAQSVTSPPVRTIEVANGVGSGPTRLAAFDAALQSAGVGNFNLVVLSSVIPPGTVVVPMEEGATQGHGQWGDRLYVVMAEMRVDQPGQQAWAGVGWTQHRESAKGLFVEHEGHSEAEVRHDLEASLTSISGTRDEAFGPLEYAVHGTVCRDEPACALVVAVYGSTPWPKPGFGPTRQPVFTLS
jgi:arginine decarboxylase